MFRELGLCKQKNLREGEAGFDIDEKKLVECLLFRRVEMGGFILVL